MRCTRCQGFVTPQAIGRDHQDRLIFGWCLRCLREEGCRLISVAGENPPVSRDLNTPPSSFDTKADANPLLVARRRGLRGLAYVLIGWATILALVGTFIAFSTDEGGIRPAPLLLGGVILLAVGVVLLLGTWNRSQSARVGLRIVRWLSVGSSLIALIWGILGNDPRRNLIVIPVVVLGVILSTASQCWQNKIDGRGGRASSWDGQIEEL